MNAEIQIMLEDLVLYHSLKTGADYLYTLEDLNRAAEDHRDFLTRYFLVRDTDGNLVAGRIVNLDRHLLTEGVAQGDLMTKSVIYRFEFPLSARQEFLTITQTFGGPNAVLPAVMDLMLLQNGILIETPMQLTQGQALTARFDWDHPPAKPPKGLAELRKKRAQQFEQRLGIASYGGLYSFIYITDAEVRHEILIPFLTFEQWMPIARKNPEFLEVEEQEAARDSIAGFFKDRNPLNLDGAQVKPLLKRLNFFSLDINDFALNAEPRPVNVYQARLGIILSYPSKLTPSKIELRWDLFSQFAPFLRSIVLVNDNDPVEHIFRENQPDFVWTSQADVSRKNQIQPVSESLDRVAEEAAAAGVQRLLRNVYAAFESHDDSEVYDALAASVTGTMLRNLYLQIKRSLLMAEQGGAVSRVKEVNVMSAQTVEKVPNSGLRFRCLWRVIGTVEHWGHIHTRENEYEALLGLDREGGYWKIRDVEILGEKRVRFETSLRGYDSNRKP